MDFLDKSVCVCRDLINNMDDWIKGQFLLEGEKSRFYCIALLWSLWKWRNSITFRDRSLLHLDQILISTVGYMKLWSVLLNAGDREWVGQVAGRVRSYVDEHKNDLLFLPSING